MAEVCHSSLPLSRSVLIRASSSLVFALVARRLFARASSVFRQIADDHVAEYRHDLHLAASPSTSAERVSQSMEALVDKPGCIEADAAGGFVDGAALLINNEEQGILR